MRAWVVLLLLATVASAQTADQVTERAPGLKKILDALLYPENAPARSIVLLVDPTPSLKTARFADVLDELLRTRRARTPRPRLGLVVLGVPDATQPVGTTPKEIVRALRGPLLAPRLEVRNVYGAIREQLKGLKAQEGRREIVLVSLENGDLEDEVEKTAALAAKAKVVVHAVAREAFISDSYWMTNTPPPAIEHELRGADGAFIDLPWGWLFQRTRVTECAPSGHAMYGISRLATVTGGRVFVWYPARGRHKCQVWGACEFCPGDHIPPFEAFRAQRVRALAPPVGSRKEVFAAMAKDDLYKAVLAAWEASADAGLLRMHPSVRRLGGRLVTQEKESRAYQSSDLRDWRRFGSAATKRAKAAERIARKLKKAIEETKGSLRSRAIAELTYVMLRVTRVNLLIGIAYCREIAADQFDPRKAKRFPPPEQPLIPADYEVTGLYWRTLTLCHGIAPFARVHFPGGPKVRAEIEALDGVFKEFYRRNAFTPLASSLGRMGLAVFFPIGRGKGGSARPRTPAATPSNTVTTRPARGGGTSGGSDVPTSGGG
ncbi:MAG: hypothetical protein AAGD14_10855 [Planctomycetota bacterium]